MAWESLISRMTQASGCLAVRGVRLRRPAAAFTDVQRQLCGDANCRIHKPNGLGEDMSQRCHVKTHVYCVAVVLLVWLPALAQAGLYKCIDENTKAVPYRGTACASGTESANMDGKTAPRDVAAKQEEARQAPSASTASTPAANNAAEKKRLAAECAAGYKATKAPARHYAPSTERLSKNRQ